MSELWPSEECLALIRASEGLYLAAYQDSGGIWTVGYGHTANVRKWQVISAPQAEALLVLDTRIAAIAVQRQVRVPLTQGQFDALTSFVFNLGERRLAESTLLQHLNRYEYAEAAKEFDRWVKGKINRRKVQLKGLVIRRAKERALFEREDTHER